MRCLVTGASGFIGGYLTDALVERQHEVWACTHRAPLIPTTPSSKVHQISFDISDIHGVESALKEARPEIIYHLAAESYPSVSWAQPYRTLQVNLLGTVHLLETIRSIAAESLHRVVLIGSSSEYKENLIGLPIKENDPRNPSSPYGVSKMAADEMGRLYFERYGIPIILLRPFFLIGPRKKGDFCSDVARAIVAVERGAENRIKVGNLGIIRDFLDVRDGIQAMQWAAEYGHQGETYNICAGEGYKLQDIVNIFKKLSLVSIEEELDPALIRPIDEKVKIGDPSKLQKLGWKMSHEITDTLSEILSYWRSIV